jgi:hypothetical protein
LVTAAGCNGREGLAWSDRPFSALQAEARVEGRPLLVLICPGSGDGATCGPLLEEAAAPGARRWIGGALALRLDSRHADALRLMRLHSVQVLPSLLLFGSGGELLVRRDAAGSLLALQPDPDEPLPLEELAARQMEALRASTERRQRATFVPPDIEAALAMARRAAERKDPERAAEILGRLQLRDFTARNLINAAETAELADRYDLAVNFWQLFLTDYPRMGARAEGLGRFATALIRSGQEGRLEDYVFARLSLNSQWEYLTVASAALAEGRQDLARRVASHGLSRFAAGSHTEALRFFVEEEGGG